MSNYKSQELDFINRTKSIITQYDTFQIPEKDKFEVTLFLNCLIGLLILPQQHWFANLPTELTSKKEWGIDPTDISCMLEAKSIKNIARHIRNSISHYKFTVFGNSDEKINRIKFEDFNQSGKKTFEANILLVNIKIFVEKFSSVLTDEMTKQK